MKHPIIIYSNGDIINTHNNIVQKVVYSFKKKFSEIFNTKIINNMNEQDLLEIENNIQNIIK